MASPSTVPLHIVRGNVVQPTSPLPNAVVAPANQTPLASRYAATSSPMRTRSPHQPTNLSNTATFRQTAATQSPVRGQSYSYSPVPSSSPTTAPPTLHHHHQHPSSNNNHNLNSSVATTTSSPTPKRHHQYYYELHSQHQQQQDASSPTPSAAELAARRHTSIDRSTRQHLYFASGGGDAAAHMSPSEVHRRRYEALFDALTAEEDRDRVALRVDEALLFNELAQRRETIDRAAAEELSAKHARTLASQRAAAVLKREKELNALTNTNNNNNNNNTSVADDNTTNSAVSPRTSAPHEGWTAYKEELKRQGKYTPTRHGPSGQLPLVRQEASNSINNSNSRAPNTASPVRQRDEVVAVDSPSSSAAPRLLDVSVIPLNDEHSSSSVSLSLPFSSSHSGLLQYSTYLLERREAFAASVTSAHSMLLLNVSRQLAAAFAHQVDVRDAAVRQLLMENRALSQKLSEGAGAGGVAGHRTVVEVTLRRKLATLQKELDETNRVASESEAAATALRNRVDVLLAALEEERKTHHQRDHTHTVEKEALRGEVLAAKTQLKRSQNELDNAIAAKHASEHALELLKREVETHKTLDQQRTSELEDALARSKADLASATADHLRDVTALRADLAKAHSNASALSTTQGDLEGRLRRAEQQRDALSAASSDDTRRVAELETEASRYRAMLSAVANEKEALAATVADLTQQAKVLSAGASDKDKAQHERLAQLEARNADLSRQSQVHAEGKARAETELARLRDEHKSAIAELQVASDSARSEAESLRKLLAASQAEVQQALQQAKAARSVTVVAPPSPPTQTPEAIEEKQRQAIDAAVAATVEHLQKEKRRTSEQRTALREALELATKLKVDLPSAANRDGGSGQLTRRVISTHLEELDAWSVRNGRLLS